jgi:hypothetical protein
MPEKHVDIERHHASKSSFISSEYLFYDTSYLILGFTSCVYVCVLKIYNLRLII